MASKITKTPNTLTPVEREPLIGTWLRGEHLEDLEHVTVEDLPGEGELLRHLKAGENLFKIISAMPDRRSELKTLYLEAIPALYGSAFHCLMEYQIKRHITELSVSEIYNLMDYARTVAEIIPEPDTEPDKKFLTELERRMTHRTISYTGLPTLTSWTRGIKRKALTTIAARPGIGKTALGLQIAVGAHDQGEKVAYFPLEVSGAETVERILLQGHYTTPEELDAMENFNPDETDDGNKLALGLRTIRYMANNGFTFHEGINRLETIEAIIKKERPGVVVIDQLPQVTTLHNFKEIRPRYVYITQTLKRIAMEQDVAIILLTQVNRGADDQEPTLANLKESGSIEEDSDNVILLHRLTPETARNVDWADFETVYPVIINLAKQRSGRTGKILGVYHAPAYRFSEYETGR